MRLLICGDREWSDLDLMKEFIDSLPADTIIIEGDARGADKMAGALAQQRGLQIEVYPAQWEMYGRRAGPLRNQQMLDEGKPDEVVYCHDNLEHSKGTKDMVTRARKSGLPVSRLRRPET
mgnify:FL=1|jgi:hypothetical protein